MSENNEKCPCGCDGKDEREEKVLNLIKECKYDKSQLMHILNETQNIYGYMQAQKIISDELGVPMAEIYGVITFYSRFSLEPKGKYNIAVCLGTACYVKGSQSILDKVKEILGIDVGEVTADGKFSLEATRCIGACGLAPVFTVNGEVYGKATVQKLDQVLDTLMNE